MFLLLLTCTRMIFGSVFWKLRNERNCNAFIAFFTVLYGHLHKWTEKNNENEASILSQPISDTGILHREVRTLTPWPNMFGVWWIKNYKLGGQGWFKLIYVLGEYCSRFGRLHTYTVVCSARPVGTQTDTAQWAAATCRVGAANRDVHSRLSALLLPAAVKLPLILHFVQYNNTLF